MSGAVQSHSLDSTSRSKIKADLLLTHSLGLTGLAMISGQFLYSYTHIQVQDLRVGKEEVRFKSQPSSFAKTMRPAASLMHNIIGWQVE